MKNDNSIIYLTLAMICVWLILDNFFGNGIVKNIISAAFNDTSLKSEEKGGGTTTDKDGFSSSSGVIEKFPGRF